jgi:hypothetical protein
VLYKNNFFDSLHIVYEDVISPMSRYRAQKKLQQRFLLDNSDDSFQSAKVSADVADS